jgi:hypothetical protein
MCSIAGAGQAASERAPASAEAFATPLRALSTAQAQFSRDGFFAFVNAPHCDQIGNLYFLLAPHAKPREVEAAAKAGRDLPLTQRQVLRLSADGKKKAIFDLARIPNFADAKTVSTGGIAVDPHGTLFLLVWATWGGGDQPERSGQYIVSFDDKGEPRSQVEVDWREITIQQFEVFGSGQFLLRGRRTRPSEPRIAVFSGDSAKLQDLASWTGDPSDIPDDVPAAGTTPRFDYMARGGDGRIYVAEQDAQSDEAAVYAIGPHGDIETVLDLQRTPRDRRLIDFRSSGNSLAAVYEETAPGSDSSSGEQRKRWWIAVHDNLPGGELQALYGPVPGPPLCYQRTGSQDRFTFLTDGDKLVTMAPPD